jgi:hypothetical protein
MASVSGGPPRLAKRLPANQRAPEREKRLVDVGPLVVTDAQAAKLTEPGEGAFHDPSPPAQATPMLYAAHSQQGHDVTRPQTASNGSRVVAAIPEHTVRPLPRSPPYAMQRGNRIDQRKGFLRVVPIRAGQTHGERHASPVANQMALTPALGPIGRIRTSLVTTMHRADGTTVHDRSRPINPIASSEPIQQREVNEIPHARSLPIAQAAPTRHSRAAHEFLREHVPGNAAAEDKQNAGKTRAIGDARPSAFRPMRWSWQERFNKIPQWIGKQRRGHTPSPTSPTRIRCRRFCYALLGSRDLTS